VNRQLGRERLGLFLGATLFIATPGAGQDVRSLLEHPRGGSQPSYGLPLNKARIHELGLCPDSSYEYGDVSRYFRLVDIMSERSGEIVYSGPHMDPRTCKVVGEGEWTIIFKKDPNSPIELFRGGGVIRELSRVSRGIVQLVLFAGPCCDDFEDAWTFVRLVRDADSLKTTIYDQIFSTEMTLQVLAQRWFDSPVPFYVEHEGYKFRYAPTLDDSTEGPLTGLGRHGNGLAEFHKGASGVALAESRDRDDRVWWLVLIDALYTDSRVSQTGQRVLEDRWDSGFSHPRWLGWMSSRYLRTDSSLHRH
jgi:hypothetical protein